MNGMGSASPPTPVLAGLPPVPSNLLHSNGSTTDGRGSPDSEASMMSILRTLPPTPLRSPSLLRPITADPRIPRTTPAPTPPADTTPPPRRHTTQPPPRCAPTPTRTPTPSMQGRTRMGRMRILVMAAPTANTPPTPTPTPNPPVSSPRAAPSPAPRHRAAWTRWRS
ncbi:hypothetical protein B0H16DRAFT_1631114 [Mycena metata]|uniref:Uncharacterized protein n=1 Tax=Mycena metata TaxID=1033252 RepID=A0AAD7H0C9_9AGAR|nr:hypothetical protein B0H16DRAFT_1631114 [Mycena metata]